MLQISLGFLLKIDKNEDNMNEKYTNIFKKHISMINGTQGRMAVFK